MRCCPPAARALYCRPPAAATWWWRPSPGAPADALYFEARADRRPVFVIPWQGLYLLGTTNVPFAGDPSEARASEKEVNYLLAEANAALPQARLSRDSVLFTYAGVRALPFEDDEEPGAVSRRSVLFDQEKEDGIAGVATILGGKLTTYRSVARDVVDTLARKLRRATPSKDTPPQLPRLVAWPWQGPPEALEEAVAPLAAQHGLEPGQLVRLFEMYGEGAPQLLRLLGEDPGLRQPLCPETQVLRAEVLYGVRREQALTLGDILLRRTCLALAAERGLPAAPAAAELLAREWNWTPAAREAALTAYAEEVERVLPRAC